MIAEPLPPFSAYIFNKTLLRFLSLLEIANIGSWDVPSRMPPIDPQSELQHLLPVSVALGILALVTAGHRHASVLGLL